MTMTTLQRWRELARRTLTHFAKDHGLGLAAQLAFYFLLALLPTLLVLVTLLSYLPFDGALAKMLTVLGTIAPGELIDLLTQQLKSISTADQAGLLTVGILGALWSSSAGMVAIIDALNRAYDVTDWRSWWKRRLVALALTVALSVFIVLSLAFILLGPGFAGRLAGALGWAPAVAVIWSVVRWPAILFMVTFGMNLIYYFAPNRPRPSWRWITPGALAATLLWIGASLLLRTYVMNFGNYVATYGALGGGIVTMLWFYVSGLAILLGAELNGVLERRRGQIIVKAAGEIGRHY